MFELKRISKSYPSSNGSRHEVLKEISLSVKAGEIFGLIGLSGAGKSTLLRVFNLLEEPDNGSVYLNKNLMSAQDLNELRRTRQKVGMIFQQFNLVSNKTVAENISLPLKIAQWSPASIRTRVEECLHLVGLEEKAHSYPHQLSGGQKQRVGIARAIANNPYLLLADEPTSALDPLTKKEVLSCLQDISKKLGLTIVITTHEMSVIRQLCHRVAILHEGRVQETLNVQENSIQPQSSIGKLLLEIA